VTAIIKKRSRGARACRVAGRFPANVLVSHAPGCTSACEGLPSRALDLFPNAKHGRRPGFDLTQIACDDAAPGDAEDSDLDRPPHGHLQPAAGRDRQVHLHQPPAVSTRASSSSSGSTTRARAAIRGRSDSGRTGTTDDCTGGNQAQTAAKNGGPAAGWFILNNVLANPGILLERLHDPGDQATVHRGGAAGSTRATGSPAGAGRAMPRTRSPRSRRRSGQPRRRSGDVPGGAGCGVAGSGPARQQPDQLHGALARISTLTPSPLPGAGGPCWRRDSHASCEKRGRMERVAALRGICVTLRPETTRPRRRRRTAATLLPGADQAPPTVGLAVVPRPAAAFRARPA
jgi:hypothetical protein